MKHFWMTFVNDGVELFGTECQTRAAAIKELKDGFRFDYEMSPSVADCNDYYIEEYWESPSIINIGKREYFKMTMGKRGGVKAVKTAAI